MHSKLLPKASLSVLSGLHLIDIDKAKIVCDNKVIGEYNRLRKLYTPHLGDIRAEDGSQSTSPHAVTDHNGDGEAYAECCTSATASSQHTGTH